LTFTHGEGFGRPLLEASFSGKPIIAPIATGQADFLSKGVSVELPHEMTKVPENSFPKEFTNKEAVWATVNYPIAIKVIQDVHDNYDKYKMRGKKQMIINRETFSHEEMKNKLVNIVDDMIKDIPKEVELKLPKLKKD
jgi:glycosyltransferase involved in cell wall biosynthesis